MKFDFRGGIKKRNNGPLVLASVDWIPSTMLGATTLSPTLSMKVLPSHTHTYTCINIRIFLNRTSTMVQESTSLGGKKTGSTNINLTNEQTAFSPKENQKYRNHPFQLSPSSDSIHCATSWKTLRAISLCFSFPTMYR